MIFSKTSIPELLIIQPNIHEDNRGYFIESYKHSEFESNGLRTDFLQQNQSKSSKGVLRGLHYQLNYGQGKLVWVSQGKVMDIAVDIRKDSPTFGCYESVILDDESHKRFYIPEGFAHGFYVLSEKAIFQYMCTENYHPEDEYGIRWDDPELSIDWKISNPIISNRDLELPLLSNQTNLPNYNSK